MSNKTKQLKTKFECKCGPNNLIFIGTEVIPEQRIHEFGCCICDHTYKTYEDAMTISEAKLIESNKQIKKTIVRKAIARADIDVAALKAFKRLKRIKNVKRTLNGKTNRVKQKSRRR